ncbi:MAG: SCP2 sterol-binding domain-containing protein [Candidatus Aenigmarchaeota archaeon]|nr:SCP2 sterol-binding domain-containing protein [Candidatus Aenigmarchaeota archaeon]
MKKIMSLFLCALLLVPIAVFAQLQAETIAPTLATLSLPAVKDAINERLATAPSYARDFLGNEVMNINVDDQPQLYTVMKNGYVDTLGLGAHATPTMNVKTTTDMLNQIISGNLDLVTALQQGKIMIEGVGFWNNLRVWFAKTVLDVSKFFGK